MRSLPAFLLLSVLCLAKYPAAAQGVYLFADTLHAPFLLGVASGDPTADGVVLWTQVQDDALVMDTVTIDWQVATDSGMTNIIQSGQSLAYPQHQHVIKPILTGLQPNTVYYYRFSDPMGNQSVVGRTRTLPVGYTTEVKLAIASCSSLYSGYFNAYRRIGEQDDLNALVHLGDYIYDFVDPDEEVRVPQPYPQIPLTGEEWGQRHQQYLLDPDFRYMRSRLPIIVMWDNHDLGFGANNDFIGSVEAFHRFVPTRVDAADSLRYYRSLEFGDLVDLYMLDIDLYRDIDEVAPGVPSILGTAQYDWLTQGLQNSSSRWHLIANQRLFSTFSVVGLPPVLGGNGIVLDDRSWDGYPEDRARLLQFLAQNNINNNVIVSGDSHFSMANDIALFPLDSNFYQPATGNGAQGVEFLPTAISRGNLDEQGLGGFAQAAAILSQGVNPHHRYSEFNEQGYGVLIFRRDSLLAEFRYSPILQLSNTETIGKTMVARFGDNHWKREPVLGVGTLSAKGEPYGLRCFPNPVSQTLSVEAQGGQRLQNAAAFRIVNAEGKTMRVAIECTGNRATIAVADLPAGSYFVLYEDLQKALMGKFSKQ